MSAQLKEQFIRVFKRMGLGETVLTLKSGDRPGGPNQSLYLNKGDPMPATSSLASRAMTVRWLDLDAPFNIPPSPMLGSSSEERVRELQEALAASRIENQHLRETGDLSLQPPAWFWALVAVLMVVAIFALGFIYAALRASR